MPLPQVNPFGAPAPAKFSHENGASLRLQAFVLVRDAERRVATLRLQDYEGWLLPGETLLFNEDPQAAADRVVKTWFASPMKTRLVDVQSYPATGVDDDRWYLLFMFEADAPADLKKTPDTLELVFTPPGKAPGEFGFDHEAVFAKVR